MKHKSVWKWHLIVPLACLFHTAGAGEFTLDELMTAFSRVDAVSAEFREVRRLEILQAPLISTGTLCYRAPDTFVKESLEPRRERVAIRGDEVRITDGADTKVLSLDAHPALRAFAESFRATLAGDRAALERYYRVRLEGDRDDWTLRLVPRADAAAAMVSSITLRGADARVDSIETLRTGGERSMMTIEPKQP